MRTVLRIASGGSLATLASGLVLMAAGTASAEPGGCYIDRGITDAVALCHEGSGSSTLQVECIGIKAPATPDGQIFGPYSGGDSAPSAVGQSMRASCITGDALGITTRAFVSPG